MIDINLAAHKKIHFIGIGGSNMSGLAMMLHKKGYEISGSDIKRSEATDKLEKNGINVYIGQSEENILWQPDLVIYTVAVKDNNPELLAAQKSGVPLFDRAHLLGAIMRGYKYPVCISGTHGKTTTSSMISQILLTAELDPTISLGGVMPVMDSNYRLGESNFFVAESCEYYDSFLKFYPHIGVILNIEPEHLDYFKNLANMRSSFHRFAQNISEDGALVINNDIENIKEITDGLKCKVISYGNEKANFYASGISYDSEGFGSYELMYGQRHLHSVKLNVRGLHNINNSVAAAAAALLLGVDIDTICTGLYTFFGSKRRFEVKGMFNGVTVVDDYSHHPTEIKACLQSAVNGSFGKIYCVFQPHTYSRTRDFLAELGESFFNADEVLILDIFSAREVDSENIHSKDLVAEVKKHHKNVRYFSSFIEAENYLFDRCVPRDLLITMGAGDVYLLGDEMLRTDLSTLSTIKLQ